MPTFFAQTDERASHKRKSLGLDVRKTKGKRSRMVPIDPSIRQMIERLPLMKDGLLFHSGEGARLRVDCVREFFVREMIKPLSSQFPTVAGKLDLNTADYMDSGTSSSRRPFINGAHEGEIKDWVGHRDSRVIELYRHLGQEDSRRKFARLVILGLRSGPDGLDQSNGPEAG